MKKEFKNIFDKIEPDEKLTQQIIDSVDDNKKRIAFSPRKAVALVAVVALVVTCGSVSAYQLAIKPSVTPQTSVGTSVNNPLDFTIVAYAENGGEIKEIKDGDITLMNYKIQLVNSDEGNYITGVIENNGLGIKTDNDIDSVEFYCEKGEFSYFDGPRDGLKYHMENEEEFNSHIEATTSVSEENGVLSNRGQKIIVDVQQNADEIENLFYNPNYAGKYLLENPDTPYDKLPADTIKITVNYKTGQSITKEIVTSFNAEGVLSMKCN